MEKIFLSHRLTGEDPKELEYILGNMKQSLEIAGHEVTCSFFMKKDFEKLPIDEAYGYMLELQKKCNIFMPIIWSHDKSKGMQLELDLALRLKQRYVLVNKEGTYMPEFSKIAKEKIIFSNYSELFDILKYFR